MKKVSVIVPTYNEEEAIRYFYEEISKVFMVQKNELEVIFIDDGSTDNTLKVMKEYALKDKRIKYLSFSRNFGKDAAMYAGLSYASGDYISIMDVDLQDPPALLPKMIEILDKSDFDVVGTRRVTRSGEPPIRSFFARCFYKIIDKLSTTKMVDGARDFSLMRKKVAKSILSMKEYNRYYKGITSFVGYKVKWLEYENIERVAGKTKWSFWKLFKYAIEGIVSFSTKLLLLPIIFSIISFLVSIILLIVALVKNLSYVAYLISIIMFFFSLTFLFMGILGEYMSKMYLEIKKRPIYIVRETNMERRNVK